MGGLEDDSPAPCGWSTRRSADIAPGQALGLLPQLTPWSLRGGRGPSAQTSWTPQWGLCGHLSGLRKDLANSEAWQPPWRRTHVHSWVSR